MKNNETELIKFTLGADSYEILAPIRIINLMKCYYAYDIVAYVEKGYRIFSIKNKDHIHELYSYFKQFNTDNATEVGLAMWRYVNYQHRKTNTNYNHMPEPDNRDNKLTKVGGGGLWSNKIRYPKKVRKTAWKRFYKLFPELKKY